MTSVTDVSKKDLPELCFGSYHIRYSQSAVLANMALLAWLVCSPPLVYLVSNSSSA